MADEHDKNKAYLILMTSVGKDRPHARAYECREDHQMVISVYEILDPNPGDTSNNAMHHVREVGYFQMHKSERMFADDFLRQIKDGVARIARESS